MYYNTNINFERELVNNLDVDDLVDAVRERCGVINVNDVEAKIVEIIRSPKKMRAVCEDLGLSKLEFLLYCTRIAPDAFNYHLLKFIKENYNFEYDARTYL